MTEPMTIYQIEAIAKGHGEDITSSILAEDPQIDGEAFDEAVSEAQDGFRQYSPFEFYAAGINARPEHTGGPERGWEAYEDAFEVGLRKACRTYGRRDLTV